MRVLLAEDELLIRLLLVEELAAEGFEVCEADNGEHAAALSADLLQPFDLLVTDLQMPGQVDGMALARLMRARFPEILVVYITGRPDIVVERNVLGSKDRLVSKPFTPSDLLVVIRRLLDRPPNELQG